MRIRRAIFGLALGLLVGLPTYSAAAAPTTTWTDQFGSDAFDMAWGVVTTPTDVYVSGFTAGTLPGKTSVGGIDGFLRRLDTAGNELWSVQFGTAEDDITFGLAMDGTGLYVMGATEGVFPGQTRVGMRDAYVRKFGFDGNEQWTVQFGTDRPDSPSYVSADSTGVYVVGNTSGAFSGMRNHGGEDVFLTRFDTNGTRDWTRQFGTRANDFGYASAIGSDGVYLNGFTESHFSGQHSRGHFDAFVALFDTAGTRTWLRQFGTRQNELALGIAVDATGVYVSGETSGGFTGQRNRGGADAYVRKFAPDGATLWTTEFGTRRYDGCSTVAVRGTDLYCSGRTNGTFTGETGAGRSDVFVKRLNATTGGRGWSLQFGSAADDEANWSTADPGALYVVGDAGGPLPGEVALGQGDAFLAKIDPS